jgi:hypothetical protein
MSPYLGDALRRTAPTSRTTGSLPALGVKSA